MVLLLHGFPEFWYSWRYQIPALAASNYHVVAPDMRGYGQSDAPKDPHLYTSHHLVGDLVGLLDALEEKRVFVVGHDWGAMVAWDLCLLRPDLVKAVVALSVPFFPRSPKSSSIKGYWNTLGEGFYMCRFQKPGRAERDFARIGTTASLSKLLFPPRSSFIAPKDKELMDSISMPKKLPQWISDADLRFYAQTYEKSGWTGALNLYRAMEKSWELTAPWTNVGVKTPALFIAGEKDLVMGFPGVKAYVNRNFKSFVPNLKEIVMLKNGGHFIQQEQPDKVNELIIAFFHEQTLASGSRL
jgi:pimeloyl-ACP methyl ester carboxylesterase